MSTLLSSHGTPPMPKTIDQAERGAVADERFAELDESAEVLGNVGRSVQLTNVRTGRNQVDLVGTDRFELR